MLNSSHVRAGQAVVLNPPVGDCNGNAVPDLCELASQPPEATLDCDRDGFLDACGPPTPFDSDYDGDVDLRDFASLQGCFTGPGAGKDLGCCRVHDSEADGDIGATDFAAFQPSLIGPG